MTVREEEELEQTLEAAQADEEDEHSEEWLITFSQEAEESCSIEADSKRSRREMMSILRNGSIFSARRLKRLQHGRLQKQRKKRQTTFVLLICGNR
jgi:hypothetical protein